MHMESCRSEEDPSAAVLTITLEIDPDAVPLGGTFALDGGQRRPFSGWIELNRAIAAALEESGTRR
jgi:hypothetical protein